jgi:MbtH protein
MTDESRFHVVINDEEQYSIWPEYLEVPAGWRIDGGPGTEPECLERIELAWTDMTPKSLRQNKISI